MTSSKLIQVRFLAYKAHIPNIHALNSDAHKLFLIILILNSHCVGVASEGMDIWYVGLNVYGIHSKYVLFSQNLKVQMKLKIGISVWSFFTK